MADAIKMAPGETRHVEIPDPKTDAVRVFKVRAMTRSQKRALREAEAATDKIREGLPENEFKWTDEQEEQILRAACDMLNIVLEPTKGTVQAGDHLFVCWEKEQIEDHQVFDLTARLVYGQADPT